MDGNFLIEHFTPFNQPSFCKITHKPTGTVVVHSGDGRFENEYWATEEMRDKLNTLPDRRFE